MLNRILTGIVGIPVVLYIIYTGGPLFAAFTLALAIVGVYECVNLLKAKHIVTSRSIYLFPLLYFAALYMGREDLSLQALALLTILLLGRQLIGYPNFNLTSVGSSVLAAAYPTVLLGNLLLLRLHAGMYWTGLTIVSIWGYDTFAYFLGIRFGKRRPWPASPKKSVEGTIGGFLGSILVFVLGRGLLGLSMPLAILLGFLVGAVGQIGDLSESALKRYVGVKDSGALLPGHGGVLDRFDSLMFAATIVYWIWSVTIIR